MAPEEGFCEAQVVTDVNFQLGDPPGTLQYFVGVTAITSPVVITNASTIGSIQTDIDNDLVYQSSGYTILITAGLPQVTALITIASTTQISSDATGVFVGATHPDTGTGSFYCNFPPQPGFCEADMTLRCLVADDTLQLFIGVDPITNLFDVFLIDTQVSLQARINANIIAPGVTITIQSDSVFPLTCPFGGSVGTLHLLITKQSTVQITDEVNEGDTGQNFQLITHTPFSCNLSPLPIPTRKRRRITIMRRCPDEIYFKTTNTASSVYYCRQLYNFLETDQAGFRHYIKTTSNISHRGRDTWWVLAI